MRLHQQEKVKGVSCYLSHSSIYTLKTHFILLYFQSSFLCFLGQFIISYFSYVGIKLKLYEIKSFIFVFMCKIFLDQSSACHLVLCTKRAQTMTFCNQAKMSFSCFSFCSFLVSSTEYIAYFKLRGRGWNCILYINIICLVRMCISMLGL